MLYKKIFLIWLGLSVVLLSFIPLSHLVYGDGKDKEFSEWFSLDIVQGLFNFQLYKYGVSGDSDRVVVGKDGWLYLGDKYARGMSRGRDIARVSKVRLERWVHSMRRKQDWLEMNGIPMVVGVAPNKYSIYPEYLPDWITIKTPNSTDRLVDLATDGGINIIDLRQTLLQYGTQSAHLYNKTDTHWTALGAYVGYAGLMGKLQEFAPSIDYISSADIDFAPISKTVCCMASMLKIRPYIPKGTDFEYRASFSGLKDTICVGLLIEDEWPVESCKESRNKRIHMNGVYNKKRVPTTVSSKSARNDKVVLFLRDSFGTSISRLMNSTFSESIHVHYGQVNTKKEFEDLIGVIQPDIVVYLIVERALFRKGFARY